MKEATKFIEIFGDYPRIRVLDFFITFQGFEYPLREIANNSKVRYSTLKKFWKDLVKNEIIIKTRKLKNLNLYKLNTKNLKVKKLIELDNMLLLDSFNKVEHKIKVVA